MPSGWNWGAFYFGPIWMAFHKMGRWAAVYILVDCGFAALLHVVENQTLWFACFAVWNVALLVVHVILGLKGNGWAWERRKFRGVEHFRQIERIWARWVLGLFIYDVLALGAMTAFFINAIGTRSIPEILHGPRDRAVEVAALRREGVPVTPAELNRAVGTTPEQLNAAPYYARLGQELKKVPGLDMPEGYKLMDATPAQQAALRRMLADHADVMALIGQAARMPRCQFTRRWEDILNMPLPELATMRRAARLVQMDSVLKARQGRFDEAIREQAPGFRLAEHAGSDPTPLSCLTGTACDQIALAGMKNILQIAGPNARVAHLVFVTTANNRPHLEEDRSLWGDVVMDILFADQIKADPASLPTLMGSEHTPPMPGLNRPLVRPVIRHIMDAGLAKTLRIDRLSLQVDPQPDYLQRMALARQLGVDSDSVERSISNLGDFTNILPAILDIFPPGTAWDRDAERDSNAAVVEAGAAVLAYRARHGAYPAELAQVPIHTQDPFTGGPLHYRRQKDGFIVYSVGKDGKFDGNVTSDVRSALYFQYPAPGQ